MKGICEHVDLLLRFNDPHLATLLLFSVAFATKRANIIHCLYCANN